MIMHIHTYTQRYEYIRTSIPVHTIQQTQPLKFIHKQTNTQAQARTQAHIPEEKNTHPTLDWKHLQPQYIGQKQKSKTTSQCNGHLRVFVSFAIA